MTTTWTDNEEDTRSTMLSRSWRRPVGATGLVALLLVAVGVVGYGAGRAGQQPRAVTVTTAPPAGSGTRLAAGIPVGYTHDEAGARSAAVNYAVAIGGPAMFVPGQRHAMFDAIGDPAQLDATQAKYDTAIPQVESRFGLDENGQPLQAGLTFTCRTLPVGVKTSGYSPDTALISVWESSLIGLAGQGSTQPVTERWATTTVTLRWASGDWKYVSETGQLGPVPVVGVQAPSDSSEVATADRDFGGLTYAG